MRGGGGLGGVLSAPAQAHDEPQSVNIRFAAVAGDQPVACGTPVEGLGSTAQAAQLQDFRFFVSDVKLIKANGKAVAVKLAKNSAYRYTRKGVGVTLIDLENGTGSCSVDGTKGMNASVKGTVAHGEYVGASWTVGVPFALNHTDAAATPAPLNSVAMGWSWQIGHKFTKIEVSDPGGVHRHAGARRRSTCTSAAPAAKATRPPVRPSSAARPTAPRSA